MGPEGVRRKQTCTDAGTASTLGHAPPTTFFLRSEREMHEAEFSQGAGQDSDNTFGVQSLDDTLDAAFPPNSPKGSPLPSSPVLGKKRKAGNPIHPKIAAAAQRIISSERPSSRSSSISSSAPRLPSLSPTRRHARNGSTASLGRSFTPLRFSPAPDANLPSTPRSGSVRSLRLSDEEGSIIDDSASQTMHSSSEDEEGLHDETFVESADTAGPPSGVPQLVMPSISMPSRRPFTERGKRIPRLKILIAGPAGVGKTSLIKSMVQTCEDIVHVDSISNPLQPFRSSDQHPAYSKTIEISETNASTKSCPSWWSEVEQGRGLRRRKSMGESVLERNICFVDTPGWEKSGASEQENMQSAIDAVVDHLESSLRRNAVMSELNDTDLLGVLSGGGGFQVDAILYMFHPTSHHISPAEVDALRRFSGLTNVIPVIGRADTCTSDHLRDAKTTIRTSLEAAGVRTFTFQSRMSEDTSHHYIDPSSPFAVSSALDDDTEVMDASVLMSSEYMQPLVPSDISRLVEQLFDPDNVQWLRHCAVKKFLQWRRDRLANSLDTHKRELRQLAIERLELDTAPSSVSSVLSSPSGVLMPQLATSGRRASSPAPFRLVPAGNMGTTSQYDFGRQFDLYKIDKAHVQLPDWAHDLKIALDAEHRERKQLTMRPDQPDEDKLALVKCNHDRSVGKPGNLLAGSVDPRDPLGLLALGQRLNKNGWTLLRVAGGCGAVATFLVWALRNWGTVTEVLGINTPDTHVPGYTFVSARESSRSPMDLLRAMFPGEKW